MVTAHATSKYIRTSAQKAGLVLDQIRGRDVAHALATLRFSRKLIARDIEKLVRSAIANAQQVDGFSGDVDRLYVAKCYANQGPSMKRIRPAPMGRAFRVVKRMAHLTVEVAEREQKKGTAVSARARRTGKVPPRPEQSATAEGPKAGGDAQKAKGRAPKAKARAKKAEGPGEEV
jgi:large subunit ribosomal protein L22